MSDGVRGTPGRPRDGSFPSPDRPLPLGFTAQWPESICSSYSDGLLAARSLSGSNSRQGLPNGRRVEGELRQGDFGLIHLRRGLTFHRRLGDIENGNLQPNTRERARPSLRIMRARCWMASGMPAAVACVGRIRTSRRCTNAPGLLGCMAVTAGMPSAAARQHTSAHAMPYRPAPNAGPATTTSGRTSRSPSRTPARALSLSLVAEIVIAPDEGRDNPRLVFQHSLERARLPQPRGAAPPRHPRSPHPRSRRSTD